MTHNKINNRDQLESLFTRNFVTFKWMLENLNKKNLKSAELVYDNLKVLSEILYTSYNLREYSFFDGGGFDKKKNFSKFKKLVDKRDNKVGKEVILKLLISDK